MLVRQIPRPVRLAFFAAGAIGLYFGVLSFSQCSGSCGWQAGLLFLSIGVVFVFAPVRRK